MPNIKLAGLVTDIFPIEFYNNFNKRIFWLKQPDTERYPQHWAIELHNQDCDRLKGIKVGDKVEAEVEIRGKLITRKRDNEESIILALKCIGLQVINQITTPPGYREKHKPGRDAGNQEELPL